MTKGKLFKPLIFHELSIWAWPGYILFFLMLFVPTRYQPVKAILLAFVLSIILTNILMHGGKIMIHKTILIWTLFYVTLGMFWIFLGYTHDAPGALRVSTVYVLWPLAYTGLVAGISNERILKAIIRVLVFATIAIAIYSASYILNAAGLLPKFLYLDINQGQAIGFYSGYIEYNLYNISSLLFLVPFFVAALLTWPKNSDIPVSRRWLWLALVLGIILVLLSGRRALMLVVAVSLFVALTLRRFLPKSKEFARTKNKISVIRIFIGCALILVVIVFCLNSVFNFNVSSVSQMISEGFDFTNNGSALARKEQFFALLNGWSQQPLLGAGHGAGVAYNRSTEMPWAYELSYVALLYQTGLIGFILYASGVIWVFWMGIRIIRSRHHLGLQIIPVLTGTACFLIGNATNPYLGKYDYIWIIFLPVAFINLWLLQQKHRRMPHINTESCKMGCPHA